MYRNLTFVSENFCTAAMSAVKCDDLDRPGEKMEKIVDERDILAY